MKLKCTLVKTDFVPMIKSPRFWISPETLHLGSAIDVAPEIGHSLLSTYPGAFTVLSYDETPKKRTKQMVADDLVQGSAAEFTIAEG
jgi:hypothetical protein